MKRVIYVGLDVHALLQDKAALAAKILNQDWKAE
ncbi:hypothetical protein FHX05_005836 [Rhizobium sp. BK491]|nr:hypothetical protein [Rhizobium sp. BK491]